MPRYYFHVDSALIRDDEGLELDNIAAACAHSFLLLSAAAEELEEAFADGKEWVITIADDCGRKLLRLELLISASGEVPTQN